MKDKQSFSMKKIYFTVGPSQVYPTLGKHILKAIQTDVPSMNHRGQEFKDLYQSLDEHLKKLLNIPENYQILLVSSALEAMERTILGCVEKSSYHLVTGSFGSSWAKIASDLGKKTQIQEVEKGSGVVAADVKVSEEAELICITQNDTSTGVAIDPQEISKIKKKYPKKLIAIDVVSSIPYVDIDYKNADITFFSVQKGFGLPSGLGIMVVSPASLAKASKLLEKGVMIGSYHSLVNLSEKAKVWQTPETPNLLNIYLLDAITKDLLKYGIEKLRSETEKKANMIYQHFEYHQKYNPFVKNILFRSQTTLVIDTPNDASALRKKLSSKGFIIGAGYGSNKENQIRIANFPAQTPSLVKSLLKLI